jgi:hypothetical protein
MLNLYKSILLKSVKRISKFCPSGTKNKRNIFVEMKTSDFILKGRKPKRAIKIWMEKHILTK